MISLLRVVPLVVIMPSICCGTDWLRFRGSENDARSRSSSLPTHWDAETNVAWKAELPGRGPSSPIVVGDHVYVTCSSGASDERLHVLCFAVDTGEEVWHRQFWATGRTFGHPTTANAAPTPASDGERIVAFFSSNDLVCLDLQGNLGWYRGLAHDWPKAGNDIGMSSSPIIVDNVAIVQVQNQGDSFGAGIDLRDGTTRWRVPLARTASWSSPTLAPGEVRPVVIFQSAEGLLACNAATGAERWRYEASCESITSPFSSGGRLYIASDGMTALTPSQGNGSPDVAWGANQLNPGAATPVVADDRLFVVNRAGVLTCASTAEGKILWRKRLSGSFWASPVLAGQHLFLVNDSGTTHVVDITAEGTVVSENQLDGRFQATPAVADDALYLRSENALWKIASQR